MSVWMTGEEWLQQNGIRERVKLTTWPPISRHFNLAKFVFYKMKPVFMDEKMNDKEVIIALLKLLWPQTEFELPKDTP